MIPDSKPDAWMPLYVSDWDSGTRHLDCEQDGAYGRLVRHYWKNGPLPDDDAKLARIVGVGLPKWRKLRVVLADFFTIADGRWRQKRVDEELVRAAEKRRRYAERAAAGGKAKAAKSTSKAVLKPCTSPSPSSAEAEGSDKPSALSRRERADEQPDGSSASRSGRVVDLDALRQKIASGAFD